MTAIQVAFRLKGPDICYASTSPFQAHHEARIERPLDDLDLGVFFQDVQAQLRVGDQVTVCAYADNRWKQLMEVGVCRIVFQGKDETNAQRTRAVWVGNFFKVPKEAQTALKTETVQKLMVKKEFGGGFTVQDNEGHVIERVKTKQEAVDYIDRLNAPA